MRVAAGPVLENCDAVVPVPLHPWRRIRRGFNQARDLAERLDRPIVDALWRVRATASQMTLDAAARHRNVSGAFVVSPLAPSIENQVVILIDDVRTTGSTLDQCAKVLLRARARTVYAVTVASAERTGAGRGGT
jgi:ComF family protein